MTSDGMLNFTHDKWALGVSPEDIIASLGNGSGFGSLKKLLKQSEGNDVNTDAIPEAQIKRNQRAANLESAKKSIRQFSGQIRQNHRSIRIDLVQEETAARGDTAVTTTTSLTQSTDAQTDFEKEFRRAIEESGMNWSDGRATELPVSAQVNDDRERRQLARIRTILRAEQIKARRLKKIKSKAYRKLLRKKELKGMSELIARLDKDDPDAAEEVKAELEKKLSNVRLNRQRQARLKWSKAVQRFGGNEVRAEVSKQAQAEADEKRELIRAIKGKSANESDDSEDDSDSDASDSSDIVAQVKKSINKKVLNSEPEIAPGGLLNLQFMRDASQRQKNKTVEEAERYLEELEKSEAESESDAPADLQNQEDQGSLVASLFADTEQPEPAKPTKTGFKLKHRNEESPDAIPGWGSWVGEGVKERRPKRKAEPEPSKPKQQSSLVHVADDAAIRAPLMKYQVKEIPYPFKNKEEYELANGAPLGPEWMSLTAHSEKIKPRVNARLGAVIAPIKLAKHLETDKRAELIDAWDNRKRPTHTKARFL